MSRKRLAAFSLACATLLVACGGGGGGGSGGGSTGSASSVTFPTLKAYTARISGSETRAFTIAGTSGGFNVTGSGSLTDGAPASASFEGRSVLGKTQVVTQTLLINGQTYTAANTAVGYYDSSYALLGTASATGPSGGSEYLVVTSFTPVPTTAKPNDAGPIAAGTRYSSSAKTVVLGTLSQSYALQAESDTSGLLQLVTLFKNTSGVTTMTVTETLRITTAGAVTRLSETSTSASGTISVTYQ